MKPWLRAQNLGAEGQYGSHPGAQNGGSKGHKTVANQDDGRGLAEHGATCRLEGVNPPSRSALWRDKGESNPPQKMRNVRCDLVGFHDSDFLAQSRGARRERPTKI